MKKHPRQRGYFGDTVRKGASGPARPGKKNARRTDDEQTFVSVPGGLDAEEVLGLMGKIRHPVRLDDMIRFLDLSRRDKKPLENLLDALQAEGRVIRLRGGKWVEASQARIVTGVLSIQRSGAGFVTPTRCRTRPRTPRSPLTATNATVCNPGCSPIFLSIPAFLATRGMANRVEVALQPAPQHRGGKMRNPEGRIIRVLERRQKELAVHVTRNQTQRGVLCRPADPRLDFLLDVDVSALKAAPKIGELLLVTPEEKVEDGLWRGTARVSLGLEEDAMVQERLTKLNHEIPLDFPPNVLAEAAELEKRAAEGAADLGGLKPLGSVEDALPIDRVSKASTSKRQDLRGVPFVTIDGEDARDFDDAVYVRRLPGAPDGAVWELWVAIADVSHFVLPGSRLDREARDRGNSYYFPTSVEPMLPEVLSNGLCSLRPDEDRLVMAARVGFDDRGIPRTSAFFPGVIRSRGRLTYEGVQEALDHGGELAGRHPYLKDAEALAHLLLERRQARGSLDFDLPEAQFIVNRSTGEVEGIKRRVRLFAHRLIEEFMLAANEAVARFLTEKGTPFPYRIHPAPESGSAVHAVPHAGVHGPRPERSPDPQAGRNAFAVASPGHSGTGQRHTAGVPCGAARAALHDAGPVLSGGGRAFRAGFPLLLPLHVTHSALCRPAGAPGAVLYARRDAGADPRRAQAAYGGGPVQRPRNAPRPRPNGKSPAVSGASCCGSAPARRSPASFPG